MCYYGYVFTLINIVPFTLIGPVNLMDIVVLIAFKY